VTKQTDLVDEWWMEPGAGDQSMEDEHGDFWNDFLANAVDVDFTGKKILDFGCNQGGLLRRIYQKTKFREAVGVDLAVNSVAVANDRKGVIPVSYFAVKNLESIDRDFDYAVSTAVIYQTFRSTPKKYSSILNQAVSTLLHTSTMSPTRNINTLGT
jgi:2-polyprenyl-3-methyl-5-hydroxy-6-metoxy-1,4-benzoquinol methylase